MTKKTKTILIILIILLVLAVVIFLFLYKNNRGESGLDILKNSNPFGSGSEQIDKPVSDIQNNNDLFAENNDVLTAPKLFQIHKNPIAGAYIFARQNNNTEDETMVRLLERGVGHIFETSLPSIKETRISNTTRLKIHEAVWGDNGKSVVIRYLDDSDNKTIRSFLIKLKSSVPVKSIPGEVVQEQPKLEKEGMFLPENISGLTLSPDAKKIFYIVNTGSSSIGTVYNIETTKTSTVFSSPITEWTPQWVSNKTISLTTKPSGSVNGFMYLFDINTGKQSKVLGDIPGLTTLTNQDNTKVLYSKSSGSGISLYLYDKTTQSSKALKLNTLPEKCTWGEEDLLYCAVPNIIPPATYPDAWYQGIISFSDKIWQIDTETLTTTLVVDLIKSGREDIDAINLTLSPGNDYLIFTNKNNLSLWGINLTNQ